MQFGFKIWIKSARYTLEFSVYIYIYQTVNFWRVSNNNVFICRKVHMFNFIFCMIHCMILCLTFYCMNQHYYIKSHTFIEFLKMNSLKLWMILILRHRNKKRLNFYQKRFLFFSFNITKQYYELMHWTKIFNIKNRLSYAIVYATVWKFKKVLIYP